MIRAEVPAAVVDERGDARIGRWSGAPRLVSWDGLRTAPGRTVRLLCEKRWRFLLAADDRLLVGAAIADLGYIGLGFGWVLDRAAGRMLASEGGITPGPFVHVGDETWQGVSSRWRSASGSATVRGEADGGALRLELSFGRRLSASLRFERSAAPALTLVAPATGAGGVVNATVKSLLHPVRGHVNVDGKEHDLSGLGGVDYTHGLLARETRWRWAFGLGRDAAGRAVGFNLVTGFNQGGGGECAIWAGDSLVLLPHEGVTIDFVSDPATGPWTVRTAGGEIDLVFTPRGVRRQALDLGLIASNYVQPVGAFEGRIADAQVQALAGVVEDHVTRW